jgi:hypothetical protein
MMIPTNLKGVVGRGGLILKKFAPEILTGVGLVSMTGGAFLAVRATLRFEDVLHEAEERLEEARNVNDELPDEVEPWSEKDIQKRLYKAYLRNVLAFLKLYGPATSLFVAGAGSVLAAHGIMRKRNVALVAAYNAVEKSWAAYRARLIEDLGEAKDLDYIRGITETSEKGEDGKKTSAIEVDPTKMSQYVRVFDETNPQWQKEPGYNQFFLAAEQNWINDKLLHSGHVFLNEVYDRLGFERTTEGAVVGWIIKKDGDNFIDFGVYDASTQSKRRFVNGFENSIWLDFNVDGVIYDLI